MSSAQIPELLYHRLNVRRSSPDKNDFKPTRNCDDDIDIMLDSKLNAKVPQGYCPLTLSSLMENILSPGKMLRYFMSGPPSLSFPPGPEKTQTAIHKSFSSSSSISEQLGQNTTEHWAECLDKLFLIRNS